MSSSHITIWSTRLERGQMCYPCITYKDLAQHGTGGFGGSGREGPPFRPNFLYFHVGFGSFGRMLDSTPPPNPGSATMVG